MCQLTCLLLYISFLLLRAEPAANSALSNHLSNGKCHVSSGCLTFKQFLTPLPEQAGEETIWVMTHAVIPGTEGEAGMPVWRIQTWQYHRNANAFARRSLTDEIVYSGGVNQCWGEILIHFHLKFPFKFSICGCRAGRLFEAAWCHK